MRPWETIPFGKERIVGSGSALWGKAGGKKDVDGDLGRSPRSGILSVAVYDGGGGNLSFTPGRIPRLLPENKNPLADKALMRKSQSQHQKPS